MFFKIFKNKQRVLILDRENRAESLASRLREHQFEIATASSEPEISPLLVSFKPDLIVVGISLPELDGIDFLRKLRVL